nr:hypothetical protein [Tanacetum cinerariifolium]
MLRTPFKKFFDSKEVNALDFQNKYWKKYFKDYTRFKPETYRCSLFRSLEELDKHIDERIFKYVELQMKEREVKAINEIKQRLKESDMQTQESLVTGGATLEVSLVTGGATLEASLVIEGNENISSNNERCSSRNDADADIRSSYDSDIVSEVHHDMFENIFVYRILNHEQPKSISNTYVVNENNSNIISNISNMDPDRDKEEHDYLDYEQHRSFFASLINNLKCDVEKDMKVNHESQQAIALLTKELERYKEKEKHFAIDKTIESEYCKKIKLLNDEISNLKS